MKTNIFLSLCLCATICCTQAQQDTLFYKKGLSEIQNNNYNKAISYFTMAIEINKKYTDAYDQRGSCYAEKKQTEKALKDYTTEVAIHPTAEAYNFIGMLYDRLKNYDEAIVYYTKAIKLNPRYADAYDNRADALCFKNENRKAEQDFLSAMKFCADDESLGMYHFNLGILYLEEKKYKSAIDEFSNALNLNYIDKRAYLLRAQAYNAINKHKEAKADKIAAKKFKTVKEFTFVYKPSV